MKINVKHSTFKRDGKTIQGEPTFEFEEFPHMQLCFPNHDIEITFDITCNDVTLYILSTPIDVKNSRRKQIIGKGKELQINLSEVDLPITEEKF